MFNAVTDFCLLDTSRQEQSELNSGKESTMIMAYSLKDREQTSVSVPLDKDSFTMEYSLSQRRFKTGIPTKVKSEKEMVYSLWDRQWMTEDKVCKASLA